ncbi:MAG TPA: hypothetical protein ENK73_02150 [Thiomicrospira sp.]|jgi:predicted esterase YcpF (UPF0227 family)|nr:hypothetical protein [Thiomicrospira sp.]
MRACICVYLHGFLSSGNSEKGQWLKQELAKEQSGHSNDESPHVFSQIITLTYPIKSPKDSVDNIESILLEALENNSNVVLMGSSMGGYYAQCLGQKYNIPYIMINPALHPEPIFRESIGAHTNPATGERFTINEGYISDLKKYDVETPNPKIATLLLIDKDDEVIDVNYAISRYQADLKNKNSLNNRSVIYSGGDHRFVHMQQAWSEIKKFVADL